MRAVDKSGGMERVLYNKAQWLVENNYNVTIITTDQKGRKPFFTFSPKIRLIDLDINYESDLNLCTCARIFNFYKKRKRHKKRLTEILIREKADIVISLFPSESSFIPDIRDGSKKILEHHFSRYFRLQYNRKGILYLIDRLRTIYDSVIVRKFDSFVVLTYKDKSLWRKIDNMNEIPNAAVLNGTDMSNCKTKRVIAVGRLDYQKGFDRLLYAWYLLRQRNLTTQWKLDIYGEGADYEELNMLKYQLEIEESVEFHAPTYEIEKEYVNSSIIVMTSRYEGLPMVLIEAMSHGVPAVAMNCPCGVSDIIDDGKNGYLVDEGDVASMANALEKLMTNDDLRCYMGRSATLIIEKFSQDKIMCQWVNLFRSLVKK